MIKDQQPGPRMHRGPAYPTHRFLVPLSGQREVPSSRGWTTTLHADPQLPIQLRAPAYDRRHAIWQSVVCTSVQIGRNEWLACGGWVRVHDALLIARGKEVRPGELIQLRIELAYGAGGFSLPPLGWYAVGLP